MTSNTLSNIRQRKHAEQEYASQQLELRRMKSENEKKIKKVITNNQTKLQETKKSYRLKTNDLENQLHKKLISLRTHQAEILREEQERLETELSGIKIRQANQIAELRQNNRNSIERINESHKEILENAKNKFMREKMKWETV